jgi:hypothetical protein
MDSEQQIFWTFFITTMCGFILTLTRQMYKSKCSKVSLCGITIERDVRAEIQLDEQTVNRNQSSTDLENIKSPSSPRNNHV